MEVLNHANNKNNFHGKSRFATHLKVDSFEKIAGSAEPSPKARVLKNSKIFLRSHSCFAKCKVGQDCLPGFT